MRYPLRVNVKLNLVAGFENFLNYVLKRSMTYRRNRREEAFYKKHGLETQTAKHFQLVIKADTPITYPSVNVTLNVPREPVLLPVCTDRINLRINSEEDFKRHSALLANSPNSLPLQLVGNYSPALTLYINAINIIPI
jgi:hypothetical protein